MTGRRTAASAQRVTVRARVVGGIYNDDWLERYDSVANEDAAILRAELDAVEAWFKRRVGGIGERVAQHLDLGTCTGRYLRWGISRGFTSAHGIDKSRAAVARCRAMLGHGPIQVHHADFLDTAVFSSLLRRQGPFDLVTMMMGTINHLAAEEQHQVVHALVPALSSQGHVVISSWRPGACALSLYSRADQRSLGLSGFAVRLDADRVGEFGIRLAERMFTPWHEIRVYEPCGA
ncbi:class I SAM-dependent methyltransferase [Streptomyces gobiensis]|uniref:class I SAM-dependent methyltransferase n=1 Tax=Streptomyces gobiensis TaxID=2875706 RepID=UPI001E40560E|nr:class I SAM-dependent methyltransferase [Streptomyces gobiensis]UGY94325.1 class I SAM-dependent methyltransferase [Streptomyces gobiensis]